MTITEFEDLDPNEFHLVPKGASGFPVLLAKAVDEAVEDELFKSETDVYKKDYSAAERRKLASEGKALSNGSYPIADTEDLHNAAILARSGHGDVAGAKRLIARRAKELGVSNPLDKDDDAEKQTAPDKSVPEAEALSQTRECEPEPEGPSPDNEDHGEPKSVSFPHGPRGDGQGDTAPDKADDESGAEAQTRDDIEGNAAKADVDMTGDTAPDKDLHEDEAESQTDDDADDDSDAPDSGGDGNPPWARKEAGDAEWEAHDADLAAEAIRVMTQLEEREKAEGGAEKSRLGETEGAIRQAIEALRGLANTNQPPVSKEIETMNTDELMKLLDERDEARRQARKAAKKEQAAKAAKKAAKAAEQAAKAADDGDEAAKAVDSQVASLQKQIDELSAKRPFVNGAGVTAVLRGPEAETALKSFDDRVATAESKMEKAVNDYQRQQAKTELEAAQRARFMAKMIAQSTAQERGTIPSGRFGRNSTDLFGGTTYSLPEDTAVKAL